MTKQLLRRVLRDTFPVFTGYFVLAIGFGMMMTANGFGTVWAVAMSVFVYAGSMQYAAVGLLAAGASLPAVALTALAVNARHLFYGISMLEPYRGMGKLRPYIIFALTDETYSLVCVGEQGRDPAYVFWVSLLNQSYWVGGTLVGSLLGQAFSLNTEGIDFALTALFVTVFLSQWRSTRNHLPALVGLGASALCLLVFGADSFLIPSMLLIAAVLLLTGRRESA